MSNKIFGRIVVCDSEYEVAPGGLPDVLCVVWYVLDEKLQHVQTIKRWRGEFGAGLCMRTILRQKANEAFWQKRILSWEAKQHYDPFLVWDGHYRWFQASNVVRLEDYRNAAEIARIRENILKPARVRARYRVA
jgi:hypothetical protein